MAPVSRIIIDAGHGGSERAGNSSAYGARGPRGVAEKDVTLDIAKHVVARLGGAAALTRTRDRNLTIGARAARGRRSDVFVSIHANYGAPELSGPEVYVHPEAGRRSRALARQIARALDHQAGRYGGGADERHAAMAVLNPSAIGQTAACLVEVDYLSNARGAQRLGDPGERAAIGAAIASAIQQHLVSALAWDLAEAIRTIDPVIDGTSLSSNQKQRLHDLLQILRDNPNANDHYVNGKDRSQLTRIGPRLNPAQFDIMTGNRVTVDLLQQQYWNTPLIPESLRQLDERIWEGIQYLARHAATDGAAMAAGLQQLKDWISERQRDPGSIYYAYGEMMNRYQGGYVPLSPITAGLEDNIRWDVLEQQLRYGCVVDLDVRINDRREPMSHAYPIDTAGKVKLPMLGLVDALDVSLQTLAQRVQSLLTPDYYRSPTVNATLAHRIISYGANVTQPRLHVRILDSTGAIQNDSGWYPVRADGTLNLPYVGSVMARGRRLDEVEAEVQAGYRRDYLINTVVHVTPIELDAG